LVFIIEMQGRYKKVGGEQIPYSEADPVIDASAFFEAFPLRGRMQGTELNLDPFHPPQPRTTHWKQLYLHKSPLVLKTHFLACLSRD
jgi:hypothetical protein